MKKFWNSVRALALVATMALVLSVSATSVAFASEDGGYFDFGGGGYDFYDTFTPSYDYYDTYTPDYGYDYYDTYTPDYGYDYYDTYTPDEGYDYYDTYTPDYEYDYDAYDYDEYDYDVYEYDDYQYEQYQQDSYKQQSYSQPYKMGSTGYSTPSFSQGCSWCHYQQPQPQPCYNCNQPKPQPQPCNNCNQPKPQPCSTCSQGSNVSHVNYTTTNTNTNINQNTNTWVDNSMYIDNSINDSFNTTVIGDNNTVGGGYQGTAISTVVPQQIIQYVQQPVQQHAAPYCVITLTNTGIYSAQATIVWSSSNAHSAYISSIGSVQTNGSRVVTGYANQIYTLTVTGQGGVYTCQTQAYTPSYVPPTYVPPQTPSVSLTQIPYTGLDMGPMGQMIYWLSLAAVAAAGAYLAVYYVPSLAKSAYTGRTTSTNHFVVSEEETEAPVVTEEEVTETPVTNVLNFLPAFATAQTRDNMSMSHRADGMPQIVISRA